MTSAIPMTIPKLGAALHPLLGIDRRDWGLGAILWFACPSFPAEAYLVLAFLGMTATEFVARAAYRPAYLAHAGLAWCRLRSRCSFKAVLSELSAVLVLFFGGVLYTYCGGTRWLLDESILLRDDNAQLIVRLSEEKQQAETTRDARRPASTPNRPSSPISVMNCARR